MVEMAVGTRSMARSAAERSAVGESAAGATSTARSAARRCFSLMALGGILCRLLVRRTAGRLLESDLQLTTPLTAYRSVREAAFFHEHALPLYSGALCHHPPLVLYPLMWMGEGATVAMLIGIDVVIAMILYSIAPTPAAALIAAACQLLSPWTFATPVFYFSTQTPISPICRTPLFPISQNLILFSTRGEPEHRGAPIPPTAERVRAGASGPSLRRRRRTLTRSLPLSRRCVAPAHIRPLAAARAFAASAAAAAAASALAARVRWRLLRHLCPLARPLSCPARLVGLCRRSLRSPCPPYRPATQCWPMVVPDLSNLPACSRAVHSCDACASPSVAPPARPPPPWRRRRPTRRRRSRRHRRRF